MRGIGFFLAIITTGLICCNDDAPGIGKTEILTSRAWNKPEILHVPAHLGVYVETSCEQSYRYASDKTYTVTDGCTGTLTGIWSWRTDDEIYIDYNGMVESNWVIEVVSLSDTLLHTMERDENEPSGTDNYWEKMYRPR